jgi:Polysaccharide biosynthesis enzyme WcbI
MERAVVIGNCQAGVLELALRSNRAFRSRFELASFPPVHLIPEDAIPTLHEAVRSAGLVATQLVDEDYRGGIGLGTETIASLAANAAVVRWPNIYWDGYFPDLCYLYDAAGIHMLDGPSHYHDRVIMTAFCEGLSVAAACDLLADAERPSDASSSAVRSVAELRRREQRCDVQVSEFIAVRYPKELLFFTMNHPTNRMIGFVAERILACIGIDAEISPRKVGRSRRRPIRGYEILGETFYPLHANHACALRLEFAERLVAGSCDYKLGGRELKPEDAVGAFFDYYKRNKRVVELNLQRVAL